jgi:hypothetical protein
MVTASTTSTPPVSTTSETPPRVLSPEARRALAEAEARRKAAADAASGAAELGGRAGPDPVRYGDWENRGIASDF